MNHSLDFYEVRYLLGISREFESECNASSSALKSVINVSDERDEAIRIGPGLDEVVVHEEVKHVGCPQLGYHDSFLSLGLLRYCRASQQQRGVIAWSRRRRGNLLRLLRFARKDTTIEHPHFLLGERIT